MDTLQDRPDGLPYDAVILAGGRAERLGGLDKPGALVGGTPLIERVAAAVPDARTLVVVGRPRPGMRARAVFTTEDPPGGGPVPALRAGLAEVTAEWVVLLAADLPFLTAAHVSALMRAASAASPEAAGAVLVDDGGREQWLTGVWRAAVLAEGLERYDGRSLHRLLGPLEPARVHLAPSGDESPPWFDCDTMDDLGAARKRARQG
ncbi:molybdenum cofactor guanylyltransferase [Planotetraspora sp. A-T 1434]|uniref:molybdenum cofactor guanylyltransferase n=1 Tax=Planotetraspora sp. A-T 1434 TaxID=2979219 RepID=UPI0021C23A43|nr:molybdenum cofactor guanylyltransferase [Planotetraspora sp. A-T 1434]MCT9932730.1 molybdenum cofactor guanylyltransferase [Planotetraspora sp. A-T 1434]